ncbi:hypothetical protein BBK36DRAFT_1172015 [Trichoderma citrinoviride]|uniref:BZIP domain-containing protein n=1 Tax=Trichoderma citrinoviride TaxID=58853 RepID=A0A2T4B1K9_9HYPO|nr:hypothetical protein BBK36DRAFT_1172015 [Trichoderma citrinoviride]PTB63215.1 hypothetical protein BBK36DRAFT_1172015 [Trichoderma citrinoviride]
MDKAEQAAGSQAGSAPRRRPGRPRMSETGHETPSEEARRTRMRLAQRSYRSRKQTALICAKARAEALEVALDGSIDEFIKFYERVSQRGNELPTGLMTQLNQTAMNIVSIARKARLEKSIVAGDQDQALDEDAADAAAEPDSGHEPTNDPIRDAAEETHITAIQRQEQTYETFTTGKPAPVSQRLMLACLTKAISLLQLRNLSIVAVNPAMLLPLQLERAERLLERVAHRLSGSPSAFTADCQYSDGRDVYLPKMMRLTEGNLDTLTPRSSPPNLQSLQFGRTRTMLHTAISDLQGEWLEAPDVEEYLEQRGIFVRMGSPSDVISLSAPAHDDTPLLGPSASDIYIPHGINNPRSHAINHMSNTQRTADPSQGSSISESHFYLGDHIAHEGIPGRRAPLPEHDFTIFGKLFLDGQTIPTGHSNVSLSGWYPEMRSLADNAGSGRETRESLKITIDIDKLIQGLADKAVCLGPCPGIRRVHVDEAIRGSVSKFQQ